MNDVERLNKYIASCGVCSRRKADELIENKKVSINGKIVTELGIKVSEKDNILVDGEKIKKETKKIYLMLNKPRGYVTTSKDQFDRKSVLDLIHENERVFSIGRLDMYTEGLLLLTNDGEFANKLMHPSNKVEKTYIANVKDGIKQHQIENLRNGVDIGDYITEPAKVDVLNKNQIQIIITEGKNRQVRRMLEAVGISLVKLRRTQVGNIILEDVKLGKYRNLTKEEIKSI